MMRLHLKHTLMLILVFVSELAFCQFKKSKRITHKQATYRLRQSFKKRRYSTFGFGLTALNYYGDLSPKRRRFSTDLSLTHPGVEIFFIRQLNPALKIQSTFLYGRIQGSDIESADPVRETGKYRFKRNASFRNEIKEISVAAVIEYPFNQGFYLHRSELTCYFTIGLGVFLHNPKAKAPSYDLEGHKLPQAGKWVALQPLGTEGQYSVLEPGDANYGIKPYGLLQPDFILGGGIRFKINSLIDFWISLDVRYLFTDYIDDVSANYVDLGILPTNLSKAMSYRSNELGIGGTIEYIARDGKVYQVLPGYGSEHPDNMRGSRSDKDSFTVMSFKISRIINRTMHAAKSR